MEKKPLFIPLKATYYDAFKRGDKTYEMRVYGPRWNEKTCYYRRHVVLSRGYGKKFRMERAIKQVMIFDFSQLDKLRQNELLFCYGDPVKNQKIIIIHMEPR
jgi:hypothetical protein